MLVWIGIIRLRCGLENIKMSPVQDTGKEDTKARVEYFRKALQGFLIWWDILNITGHEQKQSSRILPEIVTYRNIYEFNVWRLSLLTLMRETSKLLSINASRNCSTLIGVNKNKLTIYKTIIRPVIIYGSEVWDSTLLWDHW